MRRRTLRPLGPFIKNAARGLWRKTFPRQSKECAGDALRAGRWRVYFRRFSPVTGDFIGRGESICAGEIRDTFDDWTVQYNSPTLDSGFVDRRLGRVTQSGDDAGMLVYLPEVNRRFAGMWVATHPWRTRIAVVPVAREQERLLGLRRLAVTLTDPSKKSARAFTRWLLTFFEDRPAADKICEWIAVQVGKNHGDEVHHMQHRPLAPDNVDTATLGNVERRRYARGPVVGLGSGAASAAGFADWQRKQGSA